MARLSTVSARNLGQKTGKAIQVANGKRPWEYACRAGTDHAVPLSGQDDSRLTRRTTTGNYTYGAGRKGVYRKETTPVGSFSANAWGPI